MKSFREFLMEKEPNPNITAHVEDPPGHHRQIKLEIPGETHQEIKNKALEKLRNMGHFDNVKHIVHLK